MTLTLFAHHSQRSNNIVEVRSKSIRNDTTTKEKAPAAQDSRFVISKDMNQRKSKDEMISEMMMLFEDAKVSLLSCCLNMCRSLKDVQISDGVFLIPNWCL